MRHKLFGWLTPTGRFVPCEPFNHLESVGKDAELRALPGVEELLQNLEETEKECQALQDVAGPRQGEWHAYERTYEDANPTIIQILYNEGCLRVGTFNEGAYFEGTSNAIKNQSTRARQWAKENHLTPNFEPR